MARYNSKRVPKNRVRTHEGAVGFKHDDKFELINILANDFDNSFYEKLGEKEKRLADVIKRIAKKDPLFVAKALIYTRSVVGQRSVTHFGAVQLLPFLSGSEIGKKFFTKRSRNENKGGIVYRIDDMLEILAAYWKFNPDAPLPNSIRKGFKAALENADRYEIAKYQSKRRGIGLVDVMRLVRPQPSGNMVEVFSQLANGTLKQFNTVEDKNSKAGQEVAKKVKSGKLTKEQGEKVLKEQKTSNFAELVLEGKIGYLALLRNLRNIVKLSTNVELMNGVIGILTSKAAIKKSLVLPHQIDLALEVLLCDNVSVPSKLMKALDKAYELAIPNLTEAFPEGRTAVLVDTSASMYGTYNSLKVGKTGTNRAPVSKAALIGATLVKGIDADLYQFASNCETVRYNPNDSVNTIKNTVLNLSGKVGHGTDFRRAAEKLGTRYDRVFVISDMQTQTYLGQGFKGKPYTYLINLAGYSQGAINATGKTQRVFNLAGYSSNVYEIATKVEIDPKALLKEIESIQL